MSLRAPLDRPAFRAGTEVCQAGRFILPAHRPIFDYFMDNLFIAHTVRGRFHRMAWQWGLSRLAVRGVLGSAWEVDADGLPGAVRTCDDDGVRSAVESILEALGEGADNLLRGTPLAGQSGLRWILIRDYQAAPRERLLALLFVAAERVPVGVLKVRCSRGRDRPLEGEARTLERNVQCFPESLRGTVPRPLAYRCHDGTESLLLSWVPGRSAYVEMRSRLWPRRRAAIHFGVAADWLGRFHAATRAPGSRFAVQNERDLVAKATALDGAGGSTLAWFDRLCEDCERVPFPLAASHGDFWPGNFLVGGADDSTACGVLDWEDSREQAAPIDDLFRFPLAYGLNYPWRGGRRAPPEEAFRRTFLDANHVSRAVQSYFETYCEHAGIDRTLLQPLFRLYLLTRASLRHRDAKASGSTEGPAERELWLTCHRRLAKSDRSVFSG